MTVQVVGPTAVKWSFSGVDIAVEWPSEEASDGRVYGEPMLLWTYWAVSHFLL